MNHIHYQLARQRAAEAQRAAREAEQAREARAAGRRRGKEAQATEVTTPAIPDYADEMFPAAGVPAPRPEEAAGRRSRSAR